MRKILVFLCTMVLIITMTVPAEALTVTDGMISDDFNDGDAEGWWLSPMGEWSIEIGILSQGSPLGEDWIIGLVDDFLFSDQSVETQVSTPAYGGVTLWHQDNMNFVSVFAYPTWTGLVVLEVIDGGQAVIEPYLHRTWHNTWYDLRVDADSTSGELAIYLDDVYIFSHDVITTNRSGLSGVFSGNLGGADFDNFKVISDDINPVPEPATIILLSTGLLGLAGVSRKKLTK